MRWRCGWSSALARTARPASAKELLAEVARRLGNTVAVCKKSYVHPRVLEVLATEVDDELRGRLEKAARRAGLSAGERRLLAFLAALSVRSLARRPRRAYTISYRSVDDVSAHARTRRHPWKNRSFASAIPAASARWP